MPHILDLSRVQNLKPHDDESEDSDDDSKFDAFIQGQNNSWYDLTAYDKTF